MQEFGQNHLLNSCQQSFFFQRVLKTQLFETRLQRRVFFLCLKRQLLAFLRSYDTALKDIGLIGEALIQR